MQTHSLIFHFGLHCLPKNNVNEYDWLSMCSLHCHICKYGNDRNLCNLSKHQESQICVKKSNKFAVFIK